MLQRVVIFLAKRSNWGILSARVRTSIDSPPLHIRVPVDSIAARYGRLVQSTVALPNVLSLLLDSFVLWQSRVMIGALGAVVD